MGGGDVSRGERGCSLYQPASLDGVDSCSLGTPCKNPFLTDVPPSTTSDVCMSIDSWPLIIAWELFWLELLRVCRDVMAGRMWLKLLLGEDWCSTVHLEWERVGYISKIMPEAALKSTVRMLVHLNHERGIFLRCGRHAFIIFGSSCIENASFAGNKIK